MELLHKMGDMMNIDEIFDVMESRGGSQYGMECVSQLEHALQCAWLAEKEDASPSLTTAALLHDIGHLIHKLGDEPAARGIDDRHEDRGAKLLSTIFDAAVVQPVMLHVEAKRCLCTTDPDYLEKLSPASKRSLMLQGGPFRKSEVAAFISLPYAEDALRLRRWDDHAKTEKLSTPKLNHFRRYAEMAVKQHQVQPEAIR